MVRMYTVVCREGTYDDVAICTCDAIDGILRYAVDLRHQPDDAVGRDARSHTRHRIAEIVASVVRSDADHDRTCIEMHGAAHRLDADARRTAARTGDAARHRRVQLRGDAIADDRAIGHDFDPR